MKYRTKITDIIAFIILLLIANSLIMSWFSWINWSFNPKNWGDASRAFSALFCSFITIIISVVFLNKNEKE